MPDSPTQELAEERIGRTLNGKWRLESMLGVGGTAAVYAATHRNGARVAIKILHPAISASNEARVRFKREGYIVNRVEHPGVVPVLDDDIDETDGSAFIVMDRADGVSLCERVQRRLLNEPEVLEVTEQLLDILASAHEKGVIHRDLKPDNLIVDEAGRVRLLDFGIARLLDDDANLTRTGFTFGTPAYMAPEQAMGRKALIGPRTDLYAVGATMFTLLSGEYVQEAENAQELLIKIATQPARSLADVRPDASSELIDLVDRATMMHQEDRWPSAAAMLERVRMIMREHGLDGSRRHISSRISTMMLPSYDADAATSAPIASVEPADDDGSSAAEADPFAGDRASIVRGRHTVPWMTSTGGHTPAPTFTSITRPSLIRVERKSAWRWWAVAPAAAVVLIGATIGWRQFPHGTTRPTQATQLVESTAQTVIEAVPRPESSAKPTVAALVVPTTAASAAPKKGLIKKPRRPVDVGY